ncbi:MAG TPA: hypothetical protein VNI54_01525 [Thermoanaerobaculia bacterium]|nr:hypothetical protein [Thermoanaerobaculia bacterium]
MLLVLSLPLFAQGVWGARGATRSFVLGGNVLYAADGRGVSAYDVRAGISRIDVESGDDESFDVALMGATDLVLATNTGVERFAVAGDGTLERLSWIEAPSRVTHIAANARYAAAVSGEILTLLERDGNELKIARRITLNDPITAVAFAGDFLYVSAADQPLRVYLPPSSTPLRLVPGVEALDMAVANDVLWVVSEDDALVGLDISKPSDPRVIASAGQNELRLRGVAAAGSRVFAFEHPHTLHTFDVSNPASPRKMDTRTEPAGALAANASRVFVSGSVYESSALNYDPGYLPRETGKPVRAFDASTLALAAEVTDYAGPVSGVWTDGSVAYVVDPPYLRTLDVSKTNDPVEVSSLLVPNLQDHIRVKNGLAVIYGRAYVNFLDVSLPLRPRYLGTWDAQGFPKSAAAILRTRLLEANQHSGMHVIDISDPNHPVQIGGRKWHYSDVAAGDDAVYAIQHDLLLIVEIAEERDVVDRGEINLQYTQVDTSPPNASQPPLLLVRGDEGLRLYSIAGEERFAPRELEFFAMTGLDRFATGDGSAYIARGGLLHFIDLTQRIALQPTDWRVTSPMQMSVAGAKVVVADRYSVRVYGPDTAPPPPLPAKRRSARK